MLIATRRPNRQQIVKPYPIPASVGGWNARDSDDNMKETDAITLQNLFPGFGKVSTRRGSTSYATGLGATVYTLAEFNAGSSRKFIAGADGNIWDISSSGAGSSLASGFTSDKWQHAQFDDASGGARMGLVNGADTPQIYEGTTVAAMTVSGSSLTVANLNGINIFKNRSYFWDTRTQDFWYSATNALGGTLTKFPLGRVQGTGGNLMFMATWTRDAGDGVHDLAVFALSSGDVLVYAGDDPGDADHWALIGVFSIGAPLSIRACQKVGADLWITTKGGYIPLSKLLGQGRAAEQDFALSSKIRGAVAEVVDLYAANYGWEIALYPKHSLGSCVLFNVPVTDNQFDQHVVNTATGAWCKWVGMNARCFGLYNDRLYFGGAGGIVYKADDGTSDAGTALTYVGQIAWNYLGNRARLKGLTMARLLGSSSGQISYALDFGTDFGELLQLVDAQTSAQGIGGDWDLSDWDTTDWPAETLPFDDWHSAGGLGYNFSARLRFSSSTQTLDWKSLVLAYQPGGML